MRAEKWKLVNGHIHRLSETFNDGRDAALHARNLRSENHVFVTRLSDGQWAVYFRPQVEAGEDDMSDVYEVYKDEREQ